MGAEQRKKPREHRCHEPMAKASQALASGPDGVRENLTDVDPYDRSLREGEEGDVRHKREDQQSFVAVVREQSGDDPEAGARTNRSYKEHAAAAKLIDDGHGYQREGEVRRSDDDGLNIAGHGRETSPRENVVEVVKDGIYSRQLIEHRNRDGEENGIPIATSKEPVVAGGLF